MKFDVFVSYASKDAGTANQIVSVLEARSFECWIAPRDVMPGQPYSESIAQAIDSCRLVVLVLTEAANQSPAIVNELELALNRGLPIVPYRLDRVRPSGSIEYLIGPLHSVDGSDRHFGDLVSVVEQILRKDAAGGPARTPPPAPAPSWFGKVLDLLRFPNETTFRRRTLAAQLAVRLTCRRFEDLGSMVVPGSIWQELASVIADLPRRLDRIARQAEQARQLQDPGRRIDTMEAALRGLAELQTELAFTPGPVSAAMGDVVANWTSLFSDARRVEQAAIEESREIENPFVVGNPVNSLEAGLFTGRRDIALEIERSILGAAVTPALLLYGQRRMGKTSILNQLPNLLGPDFLPTVVDCQAPATVESQPALLRHISRCLSSALKLRPGIARGGDETSGRLGAIPLSLDELQNDPFSVFEDWMDAFQQRLLPNARVLLCLDEFERLQEVIQSGWGARFLDGLRHWMQHRPHFALMFVGSHTFEQLGPVWTDRFLSARRLKVSFLGPEDVRKLLTQPTPTFNLRYAPGALEAVLQATKGQPFLTQVLASELVHQMNRTRRKEATSDDVCLSISAALERSGEYFADLWFSRTEEERDLLLDLARGRQDTRRNAVSRGLREYDLLNSQGEYAVPMVRQWVCEHWL
jgi:uncharacterized protein